MRLIFIRHGDPDYSIDSLTEKGWREAELLSDRVKEWDVTAFYVSPLGRARDTAGVSLKKIGREATVCPWLKEFIVPILDPETGEKRIPWDFMPEYWTKEPLLYDKDRWFDAPVMKTGDLKVEYKKVCDGIDGLLASYGYVREGGFYRTAKPRVTAANRGTVPEDATLVFFCHLGATLTVMSHLIGISPVALLQGFFMAPTSITVLASEERREGAAYFRCQTVGDASHLRTNGEPVSAAGFFTGTFQG
jgi:probable phosphoglycerate mutase